EERATILRAWNDTARALPPATLPELFAAQAARTPDAVAVVFEDAAHSYGELEMRANQLAHYLRARGIAPEVVVGLCLERSLDLVVGLLAILKAGGAYLPLDPNYPRQRLAFMLADTRAPMVLTRSAVRERFGSYDGEAVCLDREASALAGEPATAPAVLIHPQHPAYVIYTSGSAGEPQGVAVVHANLCNKLLALGKDFKVDADFRSAVFISSAFDASIEQLLLPFVGGGTAILISKVVEELPARFWQELNKHAVTFASSVPS